MSTRQDSIVSGYVNKIQQVLVYMCASLPHDQARQKVQPIQGVPWVLEVHVHQRDQKVPVCQALPRWNDEQKYDECFTMIDA